MRALFDLIFRLALIALLLGLGYVNIDQRTLIRELGNVNSQQEKLISELNARQDKLRAQVLANGELTRGINRNLANLGIFYDVTPKTGR